MGKEFHYKKDQLQKEDSNEGNKGQKSYKANTKQSDRSPSL